MKRILLVFVAALLVPCAQAADSIQVQLTLTPSETLPGLPVAMQIAVTNVSTVPVTVSNWASVTVTEASGRTTTGAVGLPFHHWAAEQPASTYTIPAGNTLVRVAPITWLLVDNPLFGTPEFGLWNEGSYSVVVDVTTSDGESTRSNVASLLVILRRPEDRAFWNLITEGGTKAFGGVNLYDRIDLFASHPDSEYTRVLGPFASTAMEWDPDRYAAALGSMAGALPPVYNDGARLSIAMRYLECAGSASARNDQAAAGALSAKAGVWAQQLIDTPASPIGALMGTGLKSTVWTTAQWQEYWDNAHSVSPTQKVVPVVDCVTFGLNHRPMQVQFGYTNPNNVSVEIPVGERNQFTPGPMEWGQPTTFLPGEHHAAFTVSNTANNAGLPAGLTWTLDGKSVGIAGGKYEPCTGR